MTTPTYYTLLTAVGAAALTNAYAAGTTVPFTHIAVGDGDGAPVVPAEAMVELVNERHRVPLSALYVDTENPNWLIAEAVIPASVGGWTVREIGLIGAGGQLLVIGNFPDTYKPLLSEGSARDLLLRVIFETGNADQVSLVIDPSVVVATKVTVDNAIAAHKAEADPHPGRFVPLAQRAAANGVATLGADGLVPLSQLPPAIATDEELATSLAAHVDPLTDPHPQYMTQAEFDAAIAGMAARTYYRAQF